MTIAEDLKQSIKEIVEESLMENRWLEVLQESEWFSDLVESIVDDRLKEIQGSDKDSDGWKEAGVEGWWTRLSGDKYFLVRWGEGYSTNRPAVYEVKEIIESGDWNLPCDFIDSLIKAMPCEKLKFTDMSGDVYFHCLGDGKDNRGGLAAGIGYGRS
jgi:hypothetical protein